MLNKYIVVLLGRVAVCEFSFDPKMPTLTKKYVSGEVKSILFGSGVTVNE